MLEFGLHFGFVRLTKTFYRSNFGFKVLPLFLVSGTPLD
jgi:hypothetical protein